MLLACGLCSCCVRCACCVLLQEYRSSGDVGEVYRLLQGLAVPFFHHEFVKQVGAGGGICM